MASRPDLIAPDGTNKWVVIPPWLNPTLSFDQSSRIQTHHDALLHRLTLLSHVLKPEHIEGRWLVVGPGMSSRVQAFNVTTRVHPVIEAVPNG